ncbi:MAG TPA: o-succinylbenzoate synthase [Opitutae bacterium]|nr:o-succinylbenzoate synthase [Opitutae bacterium]
MTLVSEMSRQFAFKPYRRAFREPLRTGHGTWTEREGFIIRIEESGQIGYGEVAPIPEFGSETLQTAYNSLLRLAANPEAAIPQSAPCCRFGVSSAFEMAKNVGVDESSLGVKYEVSALLPAGKKAIGTLQNKIKQGYLNFKWKIGVEPVFAELNRLQELVEIMPKGAQLRLDANGSLDLETLQRLLVAIAPVVDKIEYVEQPLAVGHESVMAEMMAASGVSIALDESLNGEAGCDWLERWQGPLVVKPALMGDVSQLLCRLKPVADRVILSSVFETGVGLHNAFTLGNRVGASQRAVGFDTLEPFDDALQPMKPAPVLDSQQCSFMDLENIWKTLNQSS